MTDAAPLDADQLAAYFALMEVSSLLGAVPADRLDGAAIVRRRPSRRMALANAGPSRWKRKCARPNAHWADQGRGHVTTASSTPQPVFAAPASKWSSVGSSACSRVWGKRALRRNSQVGRANPPTPTATLSRGGPDAHVE